MRSRARIRPSGPLGRTPDAGGRDGRDPHSLREGVHRRPWKGAGYFRKPGRKAVPLPGVPGSTEFMAAYQAALGESSQRPNSRVEGTVGALICDYLQSAAFSNLKSESQRVYQGILGRFGTKHGHRMVHDMPRAKVAAYIHEIGAKRPGMANLTRKVLRKLLAHAVRVGYRTDNPVTEIDSYKIGTHHTWTETELAAFERRWPLGGAASY
jgi:hypothetical protein